MKNRFYFLFIAFLIAVLSSSCTKEKGKKTFHVSDWEVDGCKIYNALLNTINKHHVTFRLDNEGHRKALESRMMKVASDKLLLILNKADKRDDIEKIFLKHKEDKLESCDKFGVIVEDLHKSDIKKIKGFRDLFLKLIYPSMFESLDPWSSLTVVYKPDVESEEKGEVEPFSINIYQPLFWRHPGWEEYSNPKRWHILSTGLPDFLGYLEPLSSVEAVGIEPGQKVPVDKVDISKFFKLMKSKTLYLWLDGEDEPLKIRRHKDRLYPFSFSLPEKDILYINIKEFPLNTTLRFAALIREIRKNNIVPELVILDLRGNMGGAVGATLDVLRGFMHPGKLAAFFLKPDGEEGGPAIIKELTGDESSIAQIVEGASEAMNIIKGVFEINPLIVLQDIDTVSAAEITATALHDNGRALVVGTRTFGKPVGQEQQVIFPAIQEDFEGGKKLYLNIRLSQFFIFRPEGGTLASIGPDINTETESSVEVLRAWASSPLEKIYPELADKIKKSDPFSEGGKLYYERKLHRRFDDNGPPYWPVPPISRIPSYLSVKAKSAAKKYEILRRIEGWMKSQPYKEFYTEKGCIEEPWMDCELLYVLEAARSIEFGE